MMLRFFLLSASLTKATCVINTSFPSCLPNVFIPSHYKLWLEFPDPALSPTQFVGKVSITAQAIVDTTCVIVNSKSLKLTNATVQGKRASSITMGPGTEMTTLNFDSPLPTGQQLEILVSYNARVNHESATGLFLSDNVVPKPAAADITRASKLWREHVRQRNSPNM